MATVLRRWNLDWTTVLTDNTGGFEFHPAGDFEANPGGDKLRGWLEFRGEIGTLSAAVAMQTANDVDNPDASATDAMTVVTSAGVSDPDATLLSFSSDGKKYVRVGWNIKSGSGTSGGRVRGVIELLQS